MSHVKVSQSPTETSTQRALTSLAWSRHRPTTAPPLPGNFTADPNCKNQRRLYECTDTETQPDAAGSLNSTHLPRQLNHLEIPRAETVISVNRPVDRGLMLAVNTASVECMPQIKTCRLPAQLQVLVHQLSQAAPVFVPESRPVGGSHVTPNSILKCCEWHKLAWVH